MVLKGFHFLPILSKQLCLWLIDEASVPHVTRWVGVKKRYTCYMWKLAVLTFFSVKINGFWNFIEQSNL